MLKARYLLDLYDMNFVHTASVLAFRRRRWQEAAASALLASCTRSSSSSPFLFVRCGLCAPVFVPFFVLFVAWRRPLRGAPAVAHRGVGIVATLLLSLASPLPAPNSHHCLHHHRHHRRHRLVVLLLYIFYVFLGVVFHLFVAAFAAFAAAAAAAAASARTAS